MRRWLARLRERRRANRLAFVIQVLGYTEGIEYGTRRGWIDHLDEHGDIHLREAGKK